MRISISVSTLKESLRILSRFTGRYQVQPVLSFAQINANDQGCSLTALNFTNLPIQLALSVVATVDRPGICLVPMNTLLAGCEGFSDQARVTLYDQGESVVMEDEAGFHQSWPTFSTDHFPYLDLDAMEDHSVVQEKSLNSVTGTCSAPAFRQALQAAATSMATLEARTYLKGVLLDAKNQSLRLVGSDGMRLAFQSIPVEMPDWSGILPDNSVHHLLRLIRKPEKTLRYVTGFFNGAPVIVFYAQSWTLISRLYAETYPDYCKVIAQGSDYHQITLQNGMLQSALKTMQNAFPSCRSVHLAVSMNHVQIFVPADYSGNTQVVTLYEQTIPTRYVGPDRSFRLPIHFLMAAFKVLLDDEWQMVFRDQSSWSRHVMLTNAARTSLYMMPVD